jgi:hypothetical protein
MDKQLRDLFEIAAGEPPHQVTVPGVRRTFIRRRISACVAAALAVIVVSGAAAAVSAVVTRPGPANAISMKKPAYYLQAGNGAANFATLIQSTATGAITARVDCPWRGSHFTDSAATSNRTFFIACDKLLRVSRTASAITTKIYRFALTSSGRITGYALVRGGTLVKYGASELAVSPDGSELAVAGMIGGFGAADQILVINTATGSHATWASPSRGPSKYDALVKDLSFTGDGRELVFLQSVSCLSGAACKSPVQQVRALNPAGHGGNVFGTTLLFDLSAVASPKTNVIMAAQVSPDGTAVNLVVQTYYTVTAGPPVGGSESVIQVSARSGRLLRVLYRATTATGYPGFHFFSADRSRRYLILGYDFGGPLIAGWIDQGRLVPLPHSGTDISSEVW